MADSEIFLKVGDVVRVALPHSEVCVHMRVAGKAMHVQLIGDGRSAAAQLLNDDGSHFSIPVALDEAGIFTDSAGRPYVPARSLAPPLRLRLFIPQPDSALAGKVAPGSAIVGEDTGQSDLLVDYEGNVHGALNLQRYWERALHAATRHLARYPTVARSLVPREELIPVGWYDADHQQVTFDTSEEVAWLVGSWLGLASGQGVDPTELHPAQTAGDQQLGNMEL